MNRILAVLALLAVSVLPPSAVGSAQPAAGGEMQIPTIPDAVAVALEPKSTVVVVLDLLDVNCGPRPGCVAGLPAVARLLERARAVNVPVVYSAIATSLNVLPEVAPLDDEPIIPGVADKFLNPDFDRALRERAAETLVMVGTSANGAVLYTAFGANARGYTVVVAEDGISANTDFEVFLTRYQLLNQGGAANPTNNPLVPARVTLSRTDLITFR